MVRIRVGDLKNGMKMASRYIIRAKRLLPYKGKPGHFLSLTLGDNSGQVEAKVWDRAEEAFHSLNMGDLIEIRGDVREFNGALQINIFSHRVCAEDEYDPKEYLPVSPHAIDQMLSELRGMIDSVEDKHFKLLLLSFFDDSEWVRCFCTVPAAKANHQAYLGGLLEHTLNIARSAIAVLKLYPRLDRDLLLTGAILHDIGKVEEYHYDRFIDVTDQGRLLGHIIMGVSEVDSRIRHLDVSFPEKHRMKILHIITSHHGLYEWQSPRKPKFLEAAVIHVLDMLDTVVDIFTRTVDENTDENASWSPWIRSLERYIYLK